MNKKYILLLVLGTVSRLLSENPQPGSTADTSSIKQILEEKLNPKDSDTPTAESKSTEKKYNFNYRDVALGDIINEFAAEKKVNVLFPQGAQAITTKINYSLPYKVTLDQAWQEIGKILDLLGYTWETKNDQLTLIKIDPNIQREPLALYINPPLEELPDTGQVIQAIFYLSNLKVKDPDNPLEKILLPPDGMLSPTAKVKTDQKTNALIITDKSNVIRAAMTIIRQLDLEGIPDDIEVIPLYYVQATFIEELFNKLLATAPQLQTAPGSREAAGKTSTYFPPNTKVLALNRTNQIVIMGTTRAIRVVKEFIIKNIDHPLDSGKSILHIYDLQYLNAEQFAPILQQLVNKTETGQSQTQAAVGPRREFQDVIVEAEKTSVTVAIAPTTAEGAPAAATSEGVQQGGNRLVVAARQEDWVRIKKLIKDLDKPIPSVAIEVLVVDLTITENKILGDQMRNKSGVNSSISNNINFQTANLTSPIISPALTTVQNPLGGSVQVYPANALAANLLQFVDNTNFATSAAPGSLLISFNDPNGSGIWNILQILDQYTNAKILTQPFVTTADNKQATVSFSQDRLLAGGPNSDGGAITVKNEYVTAATAIDILPTISVGTKNINLQINITINTFISEANDRATRLVQTNANVGNGEVLALGGLYQTVETIAEFRTPLLGDIPLFGWLFKQRQKVKTKTNLMIFICPRVIEPKVGGGAAPYTQNKLCLAENNLQESVNFEDLRDPITRWFFRPNANFAHDVVDEYVEQRSDFIPQPLEENKQKEQVQELKEMLRASENPFLNQEEEVPVEHKKII